MERTSTGAKPQKRDADTKLAQGRLSVLELAKELGNVGQFPRPQRKRSFCWHISFF